MRGDERGGEGIRGEMMRVLGRVRTHIPRVRAVTGVQLKYLLVIIVP